MNFVIIILSHFLKKVYMQEQFKDLDEFRINSAFEIKRYLKESFTKKESLHLNFYSSSDDHLLFSVVGYVFENDEKNFEIECLIDKFTKDKDGNNYYKMLSDDFYIKAEFFIDHVRHFAIIDVMNFTPEKNSTVFYIKNIRAFYRFQKRDAFRASVPKHYNIVFHLDKNNQKKYKIRILNISMGGALLEIDGTNLEGLENLTGEVFDNAIINIKELHDFDYPIPLVVRHVSFVENGKDKHYKLGVQFTKMPGGLTNVLNHAIVDLSVKRL